jgi:hypothetical protein
MVLSILLLETTPILVFLNFLSVVIVESYLTLPEEAINCLLLLFSSPGITGTEDLEAQLPSTQFGIDPGDIASYGADAHWIFDRCDGVTEGHLFQTELFSGEFLVQLLIIQSFQIQLFFCHFIEFEPGSFSASPEF